MNTQSVFLLPAPRVQLRAMAGLAAPLSLPPMHAGARFEYGVEINDNKIFFLTEEELLDGIADQLARSGYLSGRPTVAIIAGQIHPFISVKGASGREYGSATHLKDAITSVIQSHFGIDQASVQFIAETYTPANSGGPGNAGQGGGQGGYPYQADVSQDLTEDPSNPRKKNFLDEIADSLGISTPELVGAGAVLLALVVVWKR